MSVRRWLPGVLAALIAAMAGCGGGSGGGGSSGSGSSGSEGSTPPSAPNVAQVIVDAGPAVLPSPSLNVLFVTVTICTPGGGNCATIDHVNVDTGSTGLRLLASALPSSLSLPSVNDAASNAPLAECVQFADGYSWGALRTADLKVGGEQASNLTIHVIGDAALATVPADCVNSGPSQIAENTVEAFGANGILGIGSFHEDCGSACATGVVPGTYYICPTSATCQNTAMALTDQVQQPVSHFATDNNGVVVQLPAIGSAGVVSVSGALIFGIGTQGNNALGSAAILHLDTGGNFVTHHNNQPLSGFIDSGSNAYFFTDGSLPDCTVSTGFYCPAIVQTLGATNQSASGSIVMSDVQFNVANTDTLLKNNPTFNAFDNIAGHDTLGGTFDWGLPFFFGRRVFVAIENATTGAGDGPFYAY
jgi:hypothetical protein